MRILRFIANGQILEPDPECDFTGLVSGTKGIYTQSLSLIMTG